MQRMNRRRFMAAGAAAVAAPAVVLAQGADLDAVIVGAGAAGIAAARRIAAAGRRCVVVEASERIGGRCFTDTATFGAPYDRGAHWLHAPDINPVAERAAAAGMTIVPGPRVPKLRIGRRFAREAEMENYLAAIVRARRAIADEADPEQDAPASRYVPRNLGEWRPTVDFMLGPRRRAKGLGEISAQDFLRSGERDGGAFCRQGCGAALAKLAEGLTVRLSTPAVRVAVWRGSAYVETPRGLLQARAAIVTPSTAVLASGRIRFDPALPRTHLDALAKLTLGVSERVALELPGNPLGLAHDDLVIEKASDARTAALLANVGGSALAFVDIGGSFGRDLATQGEAAMTAFAQDWLAKLFGIDIKKSVRRTHATQWLKTPWILGAFSAAPPGAQPLRSVLAEPVRDRVFFAGEATHESEWGTVAGAWHSGERAADAALKFPPAARRGR